MFGEFAGNLDDDLGSGDRFLIKNWFEILTDTNEVRQFFNISRLRRLNSFIPVTTSPKADQSRNDAESSKSLRSSRRNNDPQSHQAC